MKVKDSPERNELVEEHWVQVSPRTMDDRLDVLRRRANFLERRLATGADLTHDKREFAALKWAIAELTGIGEEVRREKAEREVVTGGMYRKAKARAEHAETLNAQLSITNKALKAENHRLRMILDGKEPRA